MKCTFRRKDAWRKRRFLHSPTAAGSLELRDSGGGTSTSCLRVSHFDVYEREEALTMMTC